MRKIVVAAVILVVMLAAAALALGAVPGPDGTIGACFITNESAARFVDDSAQCRQGESFVKFNQQGVKGDAGPAGAAGAAGSPGAVGAPGGGSPAGYAVPDAVAFLDVDGIKGESQDAKHPQSIDVLAFDHGVTQAAPSGGSGASSGKAKFRDFSFTHAIDRATPPLFLAAATGKHIKQATLFVRRAGGGGFEYYTVTLNDVLVSSTREHTQTSGAGGPVEDVSLSYAKIQVEYTAQKPDGSAGGKLKASYDLKAGK